MPRSICLTRHQQGTLRSSEEHCFVTTRNSGVPDAHLHQAQEQQSAVLATPAIATKAELVQVEGQVVPANRALVGPG